MPTWLITGCSTGLGHSFAREALKAGHNVVATARSPATLRQLVEPYPDTGMSAALDVTDQHQVESVIRAAEERFGGIDVLVNNAGYGYRGAVEEGDEREVLQLFETNFFGAVRMIKSVVPGMRKRRSGTIVNLSSIAGRRAAPGSGYYAASKFAIEGMSDALRKELAPIGIRVLVVEPGAFRTDFAGRSLHQAKANIDDYANTAGLRRKENDRTNGTQQGDPDKAGRVLVDVVSRDTLPFRLLLGEDALRNARAELIDQTVELEAWADVSVSTAFS